MNMTKQAHVFVSGKVQGVTFRASARFKALQRNIKGWIRNLPDSRVEAVFQGNEEDVKKMIDFCHKGPDLASVEDVEINWESPDDFDSFVIKR